MNETSTPVLSRTGPAVPHQTAGAIPRGAVYAALVVLFILWSNSFHAITYFRVHLGLSAPSLVTLRYGPVALFCVPYCLIHWRRLRRLSRGDSIKIILMGLFMVPGYNLALNWGQGRVPPATASLIITMNPIFTFLLSLVLLGERVRAAKVLGLAIAFAGVYLLVRTQQRSFGSGYELYALVVLLAPLSWALATVIGKPITSRVDPLLVTFASTAVGSLPFFGALVTGTGGVHGVMRDLTATGWAALLHLSILCTIVGFAVWFWALRRLPASSVSAFVFLNPPLTSAFGMLLGTEALHWSTVVYGSVTLAGVALSSGMLARPVRPRGLPFTRPPG